MAEQSKIEWTDSTFNPWIGCTKIAPACDHCYAADMANRYRWVEWGDHPRKRTSAALWHEPEKWQAKAPAFSAEHGRRRRVFCASLADVFDNQAEEAWREGLWGLIQQTQALDWLLLTKRPQNIRKMLPANWGDGWSNVWLGTTAEDQPEYNRRWPYLSVVPARLRFISYEPALGPIDLNTAITVKPDWVICGGESGGKRARHMDPEWAQYMRDQCHGWMVPFFMKQMTNKGEIPPDLQIREFPV